MQRKILHFDFDAFYASVEARDWPQLAHLPIVVGRGPRGVVATANYKARAYGIKSGMSIYKAKKLCKKTVFIRPNFDKYREASNQMHDVFHRYTDIIQPLSLDEAFLDVTEDKQGIGDPVEIARRIKKEIFAATKLTISAGVGPNKLIAKIASGMDKPDGLTVVTSEEVISFLRDLPIRKIPGIGPVSEQQLWGFGIKKCSDFWEKDDVLLKMLYGNSGPYFKLLSLGIDDSPVAPRSDRKSCGIEDTFPDNIASTEAAENILAELAKQLEVRLSDKKISGRTVVLKVKYANFQRITRQKTLINPVSDWRTIHKTACDLLKDTQLGEREVRLLGLAIGKLVDNKEEPPPKQKGLFDSFYDDE